ncbi:SDR family oxidoreductase [Aquincola sp. J276]|uniref:SDR family oxidoreductase n=1 Tax=Aquincola sp. J276 TaxID=2898432 RepID=UPI002151C452|nr:SDR family oxidoreductase [Aquincola sp. J276]MCR5867870.1 SDR family oxidoreductase [Aquincola sp. J276]
MLNPAYTTSSSRAGSRALGSRVVVLTGASSGIGRATALALAEQGATVVLAARDRAALEAVAAECERRGGEALAVPTDVVDAAAVRALADAAISRFGSIDVWINNAGVGVVGRFDEIPIAVHRRVVETNLLGEMNGAHAAVQHFRQQQRGTLINMVSIGAWAPTPYAVAYTASKFGLRGFSEALRAELRDLPDVHVCEVYPTFVDTPGFQNGGNYTGRRLKTAAAAARSAAGGAGGGGAGQATARCAVHRQRGLAFPAGACPRAGPAGPCHQAAVRHRLAAGRRGPQHLGQPVRSLAPPCGGRRLPGRLAAARGHRAGGRRRRGTGAGGAGLCAVARPQPVRRQGAPRPRPAPR